MADQNRSGSPQDDRRRGFIEFDYIPFEDIVWGKKLGSGSFGLVHRGTYLGIDIAIKEILPSTEYDVNKYFLREHTIMRECRHPNIALFIGLSHAPPPDSRVFIVSEYIPGGNLRAYIQDTKSKPFPWRLRISFAIDIARALAYLHARKCIHRDLKPENLLVTGNERIKIAARDDSEMKRMSYCGTDGYMAPELMLGFEFSEVIDVFSLGIVFAEIISRTLVENGKAFTRFPPFFSIEEDEVREKANKGCPTDWINLALHCTASKPEDRPSMREVLDRLTAIEAEIARRIPEGQGEHIGSIKITSPLIKTPRNLRRLFSKDSMTDSTSQTPTQGHQVTEDFDNDSEEDEVVEMLHGSAGRGSGSRQPVTWRTARWEEPKEHRPNVMDLFESGPYPSEPSTHLPGSYPPAGPSATHQSTGTESKATIRPFPTAGNPSSLSAAEVTPAYVHESVPEGIHRHREDLSNVGSVYYEAQDGEQDTQIRNFPQSTPDGSFLPRKAEVAIPAEKGVVTRAEALSSGGVHRFTLVNLKARKNAEGVKVKKQSAFIKGFNKLLSPAGADKVRCAVCARRIARDTYMQCDDCNNALMPPSEIAAIETGLKSIGVKFGRCT